MAFWWSGQFASLAAVPSAPGWSLITSPYYYDGSADKSKTLMGDNVRRLEELVGPEASPGAVH